MATHSSTLAWKIPWTEEPGRLQPMGLRRVGHHWATSLSLFTFHFPALEKEMTTHSTVLAWRIWGTAEPGGLLSMGSQSRTQVKRLSSSSSPWSRELTDPMNSQRLWNNPRSSLTVASWGFQWSYKRIIWLPSEAVSHFKAKSNLLHLSFSWSWTHNDSCLTADQVPDTMDARSTGYKLAKLLPEKDVVC